MTFAPIPILLLPGALPASGWLSAAARAACLSSPVARALAARMAQTLLSPACVEATPEPGHERWLRERFGLSERHPFAACGPAADGCPQAHWRIDPVHLHLGRDHLVLTDPARLALTDEESSALRAAAAPLLADEGLEIVGCARTRWALVQNDPARALRLRTHPLASALGRSIEAYLPQGDDARRWRRILNEVQMTWHMHPVNVRREARGQPGVNGLWIEGPCPQADSGLSDRQHQAAGVLANHAISGLGEHIDQPGLERPDLAKTLCVDDGRGTIHLDSRLMQAQLAGDPQGFRAAWSGLEASLFSAIIRRESPWQHGVTLVLTGDSGWRSVSLPAARSWSLGRLWRRPDCSTWLDPITAGGISA